MTPVCSVRPGAARILGTGLCTTAGTLNLCASCEESNSGYIEVTCPAGQTPVCSNYHSLSVIRPAPTCVTNALVPVHSHIDGIHGSCNSG